MIKEIKEHTNHYAMLGSWLALGVFLFVFLGYSTVLRFAVVIVFALGYVVWGVVHHHLNRDLSGEIVLEYVLIALLTVVVVGGTLLQ